jgi:hypothetical protein
MKIIVRSWFKVMLQILRYHFFRHLAYRGTEIASCPKMPAPKSFLQVRELFEQLPRRATLEAPHDLTRRHRRGTTHQDVYVIFAHNSLHYPDLKSLTRFSYQLSNALRYVSTQYFVAVFCNPYKVILNLKNRMTAISIIHVAPPFMQHFISAKADRLKPVV